MRRDWRTAPSSARQRTICEFAAKLTATPSSMSENDLAPLRAVGLDDAGILDVVQIAGYFNYITRVADALGVPDEPGWKKTQ
jgi:uncharacterized peroxidase-related enzyme